MSHQSASLSFAVVAGITQCPAQLHVSFKHCRVRARADVEVAVSAAAGAAVANGNSNGAAALQQGAELARGQVWFVPAGTAVEVSVPAQLPQSLVIWAAACNSKVRQFRSIVC